MISKKFGFFLYILGIVGLFFYSFTQVDLSLTLSKASFLQSLEKQFQYIGFFQRPLSALIFSIILVSLFICYVVFLYLAKTGKLQINFIFKAILFSTTILIFSYNAFSYDLFNYIFDAKIITFYHQNPYLHKAMDFPNDPMLHFMRWTHRLYPYGPSWLLLTVPLSFIGMQLFLPTFFIFKALIGITFLGSAYLIYKISESIFPKNKVFNTVFFAFNPLIIIETLVSGHNDMPMIFLILLSIYLFLQKKLVFSWISNIFSIGIKFSTGILFPLFIILEYFNFKNKKIIWDKFFLAAFVLSLITVVFATLRTNFQSWYLLFPLSMSAFVSHKNFILIIALISSIFASLIYVPYVYMSDYAKGYPLTIGLVESIGLITVVAYVVLYFLKIKLFIRR